MAVSGDAVDAVTAVRDRIAAVTDGWDRVEQVTMFGCPAFTAGGELFCVVSEQGLSLTRLPEAAWTDLSAVTHINPFVAGGRTVAGWATIADDDLPDDEVITRFVRASYAAAIEEATR